MAAPYEFSEVQAIDILDMQLRQLTRLSRIDLETELADVRTRIEEFEAILADDEQAAHGHQGRAAGGQGGVRQAARVRAHL